MLFISMSVCLSGCVPVYVCVRMCTCTCWSVYLWPSTCLPVYAFVCLSASYKHSYICVLDVAQTRPGAPELDSTDAQALNWITIIGCSLSGVGLLITLLSASCVR